MKIVQLVGVNVVSGKEIVNIPVMGTVNIRQ